MPRGSVADRAAAGRRAVARAYAGFDTATSLAGRALIVMAVVGLWLGTAFDWREVVLVGLMALVLLLVSVAWVAGRSELEVEFDLHSQRVTAGEEATGRVLLTNKRRRSAFGTRIELAVGAGRASFFMPPLARDEQHQQLFEVPTRRRGVISLGPVRSVRSDPLGLLRRVQVWSRASILYVHPVTVHVDADATGFLRDVEGVVSPDLSSNDVSFHALREYVPGDDRRSVHWRTTARMGTLMVKQFEETRRAHLLIVLPTHLGAYADADDLETAISVAGSMARQAFAEEREVSIFTEAGLLRATTPLMLLDRLAEIEPAPAGATMRDLTSRAIGKVPNASSCLLLCGAAADPRDLRAADKSLPLMLTRAALRVEAARTLTRRRVGDLTVLDLPDLAALPRAMRGLR